MKRPISQVCHMASAAVAGGPASIARKLSVFSPVHPDTCARIEAGGFVAVVVLGVFA